MWSPIAQHFSQRFTAPGLKLEPFVIEHPIAIRLADEAVIIVYIQVTMLK